MPERQARVLARLRELGPGSLFTYLQVAAATGMTSNQACLACLALLRRGDVDYFQWIGDYGSPWYELRRA